jgi:ATP phosphoribosyltransferase
MKYTQRVEKLRILIPKGRIFDNIALLFSSAGFPINLADRTYRPTIKADWLDAKIMKPQNVGSLLELGRHDAGFTGLDWLEESGADVEKVMDLGFDKVRIVSAVPKDFDTSDLKERRLTVATEYVNIADKWLSAQNYNYHILRTYGATEVFPPDDADMIIDNTSSGQTLKDNGLKITGTLLESSTYFVASKAALANPEKRGRIQELAMLFQAVLDARDKVMFEMNVTESLFDELVAALPCMRSPTVSPLYGEKGGFAVRVAVKRDEAPELIPILKKLGATDIVEYDLRKVVP